MESTPEILTIQKFVYLLNDFYYQEFAEHLRGRNLKLSLKLVEQIHDTLPNFESPEALCKRIYGEKTKDAKLKFNQLASHTFRQSAHLAINYPYYLTPNYTLLTQLVNAGEIEKTEFLANTMLDIAGRIEDRASQLAVLKFLIQRALLMKRTAEAGRYMAEVRQVRITEMCCDEILSALRIDLNSSSGSVPESAQLETYKRMFLNYRNNESKAIRLLAQYAYIYQMFYFDKVSFYDPTTRELMNDLDRDIEKYKYVVLPFGFDLKSSYTFYKLNSPFADIVSPRGRQNFEELQNHYKSVLFWKSYLNIPELFTIATKTSYYLTQYISLVFRDNYLELVNGEDLREIRGLADRCIEMLSGQGKKNDYKSDFINLTMLRAGLLILSGDDGPVKAAEELELMLTSYQQHNFGGATDSIFLFLMISYFCSEDYDKCKLTFGRYSKSLHKKTFSKSNDIEIHIYFYASQWLKRHSKQYLRKLKATYQRTLGPDAVPGQSKRVLDTLNYLNIPFESVKDEELVEDERM